MADDEIKVLIQVESEEEARELEALIAETSDVSSERQATSGDGFAPLIIIAIIGAVGVVGGVANYWYDKLKGGQVIDLTPDAKKIAYRTRDVVYGLVVIRTKDGNVKVEVHEPKGFFLEVIDSVLTAVQGVAEKSLDAVAAAVKAATGDRGNVTSDDDPVPAPA